MTATTTTPDGHGGHGGHSDNAMYHSEDEEAPASILQPNSFEVGKAYELVYRHPNTEKLEEISGTVSSLDRGQVRLMEPGGRYRYLNPGRVERIDTWPVAPES